MGAAGQRAEARKRGEAAELWPFYYRGRGAKEKRMFLFNVHDCVPVGTILKVGNTGDAREGGKD